MYWLKVFFSRLESRNVNQLILVIFLSIVLVAMIVGTTMAYLSGAFQSPWGALWWVSKALLGPDFLDDSKGFFLSMLSLCMVVVGFVAFSSGTIALISTLVAQRIEKARSGTAKIPLKDHIVILNFSQELDETLHELLVVDKGGQIAILSPSQKEKFEKTISISLTEEVKKRSLILCREGSPYNQADLERVNIKEAAKVIILSPDSPDTRTGFRRDISTLKLLMLLKNESVLPPTTPIISVVNDSRSVKHIESLVKRDNLVLINADGITGSILCQSSLHPHLAQVFGEILSYEGNEFYIVKKRMPEGKYSGPLFLKRFLESYPEGVIPLGVRDGAKIRINPETWALKSDPPTEIIVLSKEQEEAWGEGRKEEYLGKSWGEPKESVPCGAKILITGQNRRLPYILAIYRSLVRQGKYSFVRLYLLTETEFDAKKYETENFFVEQDYYDVLIHSDRFERLIAEIDFNSILILSREDTVPEQRDVNVLAEALLVSEALSAKSGEEGNTPRVIVELLDQRNAGILEQYDSMDVVVTSQMVGRLIAQCVEEPGIKGLFDEILFHPKSRIMVRPSTDYAPLGSIVKHGDFMLNAASFSQLVLGVVIGGRVLLNPPLSNQYEVSEELGFIVLG